MKLIFDLANDDTFGPREGKRALIGSPGVGKSVLFFLVARIKACRIPVVYYRKTRNVEDRSLLFMNVTEDKKVRIAFTRNFPVGTDSKKILNFLNMQQIDVNSYYTFVDGPRYNETNELFYGYFDYFCTSGGYPLPKDEEQERDRLWILYAWTEGEVIAALTHSSIFMLKPIPTNEVSTTAITSADDVKKAYRLCGGSIRRMLKACENSDSFTKIQERLETIVRNLRSEKIELAVTKTVRDGNGCKRTWNVANEYPKRVKVDTNLEKNKSDLTMILGGLKVIVTGTINTMLTEE